MRRTSGDDSYANDGGVERSARVPAPERGSRGRRLWLLVVALLLAVVLAPVAFSAWVGQVPPGWLPTPLVQFAFDVRLATAPLAKKAVSLARGSPVDKRVYLAGPGEEVRFASGSVELTGALYRPGRSAGQAVAGAAADPADPADPVGPGPGVVLVHGSTPEGRRMGLYRILAESLATRGYVVLSIDQRGFGDSAPARDRDRPDAYDHVGDAARAMAYLAGLPEVDSAAVSIIGHSFGASVAVTAGLAHPPTRAIVMLGASPPDSVPFAGPTRADPRTYGTRRDHRYGSMRWTPGVDYVGRPTPLLVLASGPLADPGHAPLLVVTDRFEGAEAHARFEAWARTIGGRTRLVIAPRADHYFNTAGWGRIVVYDVQAVGGLVAEVDGWLGGSPAARCGADGACPWPGASALLVLALVLTLAAAAAVAVAIGIRRRTAS